MQNVANFMSQDCTELLGIVKYLPLDALAVATFEVKYIFKFRGTGERSQSDVLQVQYLFFIKQKWLN